GDWPPCSAATSAASNCFDKVAKRPFFSPSPSEAAAADPGVLASCTDCDGAGDEGVAGETATCTEPGPSPGPSAGPVDEGESMVPAPPSVSSGPTTSSEFASAAASAALVAGVSAGASSVGATTSLVSGAFSASAAAVPFDPGSSPAAGFTPSASVSGS